ncbi:hypothetical protein H5410_022321 [Solanum commersonii]|uniref:Uncharacterized protein n=1 Tax=Solanum commersonii TaxID=4109 RepID=A0A9J5ZGT9_SOLCO|nr:hypothetical protein H5410_022321 [Solanum commersonii]
MAPWNPTISYICYCREVPFRETMEHQFLKGNGRQKVIFNGVPNVLYDFYGIEEILL